MVPKTNTQEVKILDMLVGSKYGIDCQGTLYLSPAMYRLYAGEPKGWQREAFIMTLNYYRCYQNEILETARMLTADYLKKV